MKGTFATLIRRGFHAYRNGPIRIGHSFIRRVFDPMMDREQEVQLRSGLKLCLDMSKGNQNAIFWHDGDVDIAQHWAIRELVPIGGLFMDCGANCGLMGLQARRERQAKVIFFEPHPRLAKSIAANIELNGFRSSCELIAAAVSSQGGEISFYEDSRNDGSHAIQPPSEKEREFVPLGKVPCVSLKEIIEARSLSKIHFLKIDTEGNDYPVLQGMGDYLSPSRVEIIYVEMTRDQAKISDLMRSRGYMAFVKKNLARRQTVQRQKFYERGGSVAFFELMADAAACSGDVLWCGENSAVMRYLSELSVQ
jgi:FkbM family methyltransferase